MAAGAGLGAAAGSAAEGDADRPETRDDLRKADQLDDFERELDEPHEVEDRG
jgi:hypothetical protein